MLKSALVFCALFTVAAAASAAQALNADQVKALFTNKTVEGRNEHQGFDYKAYYAADGTAQASNSKGRHVVGTWRVDEQGRHCVTWGNEPEVCGVIVPAGHGTYQRIVDGKVTQVLKKITAGKHGAV